MNSPSPTVKVSDAEVSRFIHKASLKGFAFAAQALRIAEALRDERRASGQVEAEVIETVAWNCDMWADWLSKKVEEAMEVSERLDMSTEQVLAYAILSTNTDSRASGGEGAEVPAFWHNGAGQIMAHTDRELLKKNGKYHGRFTEPLYTHPSPSPAHKVGGAVTPDHCYDPNDWEYSISWDERDTLIEDWPLDEVHKVATLIDGPAKWVVWIATDEGAAALWFDSEADAKAALEEAARGK